MTLGHRINTLRSEKGLSQKELAAQLGVATGTIAGWEADEATPNLSELSRLSKALNVSSDVLLEATTEELPIPVAQPKQEPSPVVTTVKKRKKTAWIIGAAVMLVALVIGALFLFRSIPFSENASAIEAADASVVTVFCYDYEGELAATGSGFIAYDSKTIITNYHVMTSAYTCKISTNQDISYEISKILGYSKEQDIAILQLAEDTKLTPLTLGDSNIIKKGEAVVAIGSPLGIKNTVSTGVLSGRLMEDNMDVLQFTAPISNGSSGGALFNDSGEVIGITYASYDKGQNLNLAIPINEVKRLYDTTNTLQAKNVSSIFLEENPNYEYLDLYSYLDWVSISDLKKNPIKFDDQLIILKATVSSTDTFTFLVEREHSTGDYNSDSKLNDTYNFEETPLIYLIDGVECVEEPENIEIGDELIVIGEFRYHPKGEEHLTLTLENNKVVTVTSRRKFNNAELRAYYILPVKE